jgi:hypothetical protein
MTSTPQSSIVVSGTLENEKCVDFCLGEVTVYQEKAREEEKDKTFTCTGHQAQDFIHVISFKCVKKVTEKIS